jgi:hypothetical protein
MKGRIALTATLLLLGACNGGGGNGSPSQSPLPEGRPSSGAFVGIDAPRNADTVKGPNIHLLIRVERGRLVPETTTTVKPDEGHLRVTLDQGVAQPGKLDMTIPNVAPGEHVFRVEFVASDNKPFDPRVQSAVLFNVT